MKIAVLIEGRTEKAFKPFLNAFLEDYLGGRQAADEVIGLTDVYTGHPPPLFLDANDAKQKMTKWVGNNPKFHPHTALHDFESWLIPNWTKIQKIAKSNRSRPGQNPETVNHNNPPAYRIKEIFEIGGCKKSYSKTIDGPRILRGESLLTSIDQCSELKSFVNRIITLSGGTAIP